MGWLTDWDDVVHGTAVFGAAIPFAVALLLGWRLPGRWWIAVAAALSAPIFWNFGLPSWPLKGSNDAMAAGLITAVSLVTLETTRNWSGLLRLALRAIVWAGLGWLLYPAWLAAEGGFARRLLVIGALGFSTAAWAACVEFLAREKTAGTGRSFRITPAVWVPTSIALAVLLQFGGTTQFSQSAVALAASIGGVCLLLIRGSNQAGLRPLAALWGMFFALLAWSGWLFAGIQVGATLALLLSPLAAVAARQIPLPRRSEFSEQLWDALAAALVAALVIAAGWIKYSKGADSFGY